MIRHALIAIGIGGLVLTGLWALMPATADSAEQDVRVGAAIACATFSALVGWLA